MEFKPNFLFSLASLLLLFPSATATRVLYHVNSPMLTATSDPPPCDATIVAICNNTDTPDLCISSITPYLNETCNSINTTDILRIEIKACSNETNVALSVVKKIAKHPKTPPEMVECLEACQESYNDALDNLQNAVKAIDTSDKNTLNSMLSAASTDYDTCEDGFAEFPGIKSPMKTLDDLLSKLAGICLVMSAMI